MRRGRARGGRKSFPQRRARQYRVVCCVCGDECMVPVMPPADRKLTCLKCLDAAKTEKVEEALV